MEEVREFLRESNLQELENFFEEQKLDYLSTLMELREAENIKEFVPLLGNRFKLIKGLDDLRKKSRTSENSSLNITEDEVIIESILDDTPSEKEQ